MLRGSTSCRAGRSRRPDCALIPPAGVKRGSYRRCCLRWGSVPHCPSVVRASRPLVLIQLVVGGGRLDEGLDVQDGLSAATTFTSGSECTFPDTGNLAGKVARERQIANLTSILREDALNKLVIGRR